MSRLADIRAKSRLRDILEGQPQHIGMAVFMACGAVFLLREGFGPDQYTPLGLDAARWAMIGIAFAILHQVIVAIGFRLQLHCNLLSRLFGRWDMAIWAALFMPLLVARPVFVSLVGWTDSVPITESRGVEIALGLALLAPAIWGMHSVLVHFTIPRAFGGDHFRDEIAALPLVSKGVFRYVDNAMYGVVFLGLWGIALLFGSWNALILAAFQHAYIWVHMYTVEGPDMAWIYGDRVEAESEQG
ncbi:MULTISPECIES: phosphatidylethanolamine N-methyltransferase family protein [Shimia]|uniref:phosphatidylethanolamine N-methyltransferase family protein n=1 Tax=Shimia TaxID=573139 RepID=UPI001FB482C9|nr:MULTISPECIES: phosphatidylethanolamine N-methyltransferase family protein [Shimia]MDV4144486.1 phosphatidylethanolamine N-methyltransferase family protein [Shimia sp. FJ5]